MRRKALTEANNQNKETGQNLTQHNFLQKTLKLQDEQRWLEQIKETELNEDNFLAGQKNDRIQDLRDTYAAQRAEKTATDKFIQKC